MLRTLTMRNFRCHRDLTVEFRPGINGIVGENGSGKSSILEAIQFAMIGEGNKPKDQLVTSGSIGPAYVRLEFELHGKVGSIERHLNASRVVLEYDGKRLIKASEVKELWHQLLQIDPHIFKHIIVARQKHIPELLNADSTVREKAFQKVFMVPPTEQLRSLIWDRYIKECPPPFAQEDETALTGRMTQLEADLLPVNEGIDRFSAALLDDQQVATVVGSMSYLDSCMQAEASRPGLMAQLENSRNALEVAQHRLSQMDSSKVEEELKALEARSLTLAGNAHVYSLRMQLTKKLQQASNELMLTPEDETEINAVVTTDRGAKQRQEERRAVVMYTLKDAVENHLRMGASGACSKCGRPFSEDQTEKLKQQVIDLQAELDGLNTSIKALEASIAEGSNLVQTSIRNREAYARLHGELSALDLKHGAITEDPSVELAAAKARTAELRAWMDERNRTVLTETKLAAEVEKLETKLNSQPVYGGHTSAAEEYAMLQNVLKVDRQRRQEVEELRRMQSSLCAEISMIRTRIADSAANREKNRLRSKYLEDLQKVYDAFHTSEFPRRLIQTYAGDVEAALTEKLQMFNLPYRIRIGEGFKIEIYDADDRLIPDLSGGQEMVVGICLRLALHSMFSQSFPLLVIDEGTTHLSESRRHMYFDCIRTLKQSSELSQVLIIDHDPELMDVVDHVIKL